MTDFGRQIDIAGSGAECPPEGRYAFQISRVEDPQQKPGFEGRGTDIQSKLWVILNGYKYDANDEDDFDWNGHEVSMFAKWAFINPPDPKKPNDEPKTSATFKSAKSTSGKFLRALYPERTEDDWKAATLDLDDLDARWFSALLSENNAGWPKLSDFRPYVPKQKASRPAPAPAPQPAAQVQEALDIDGDDSDLYDD